MANHLKHPKNQDKSPVYLIHFDEYLKPKSVNKNSQQLLINQNLKKPQLRLKLLEHPVLVAGHKSKWRLFKEKCRKFRQVTRESLKSKRNCNEDNKIRQIASKWRNKTLKNSLSRFSIGNIKLPRFLAFLKARNDDGLCKRKSGFEIYCEMASIHGFINFVGATTWQRAFWCFVVFLAITISGFILLLSHLMNTSNPTILYTEGTQYPMWPIAFPAVTICNMNRISKRKATILAEKFHKNSNLTIDELIGSFPLAFYASENIKASAQDYHRLTNILHLNNFTLGQLLNFVTPNCEDELLRCKWKGRFEKCQHLFQKVQTSMGQCCAFNYFALKEISNKTPNKHDAVEHTTSCGAKTGLTVLLDPFLDDYKVTHSKIPGFQVLIHDAYDVADTTAQKRILTPTSVNKINIEAQRTHATNYINSEKLPSRRCYLSQERPLFLFRSYSQTNCIAECRSEMLYEKCNCTLANWVRKSNWSICGLADRECILKNKAIFISDLKYAKPNYRGNHYAEQFICDCYPLCNFNMYGASMDSGQLDRRFSLSDKRFFKDINITNHILLHVFYGELYGERLRLDVYENWLSFIGTFGGITGLQMGYSFVSGFELIFFVFVRPVCNWLTKKQIKYRIKRRHRKLRVEQEKKRKLEEKMENQERIEAYLKMRPYCPGY